jgi:hypothetical protein
VNGVAKDGQVRGVRALEVGDVDGAACGEARSHLEDLSARLDSFLRPARRLDGHDGRAVGVRCDGGVLLRNVGLERRVIDRARRRRVEQHVERVLVRLRRAEPRVLRLRGVLAPNRELVVAGHELQRQRPRSALPLRRGELPRAALREHALHASGVRRVDGQRERALVRVRRRCSPERQDRRRPVHGVEHAGGGGPPKRSDSSVVSAS